jgi:hypothetical protein
MTFTLLRRFALAFAVFAVCLTSFSIAQDGQNPPANNAIVNNANNGPNTPSANGDNANLAADPDNDPPGRAVDLRYISGQISIQPGGVNDWVEAAVNRPLTTADRVWADKDSRAELHLGTAALRINSETSMTLTNVNDQTVQVELDQGTLGVRIRKLHDGETYEIDSQNMAFTISQTGSYRFEVDPNAGTTKVMVFKGAGEATGQGPSVKLSDGNQATFTNGESLQHTSTATPVPDGFDDWCRVRDEQEDHSQSAKYVSADISGASDLDAYGTWRDLPGYGPVWNPSVGPGWAPYHYGHWAWVAPWGWTWVDSAPWGYAPAHYGRWVFVGGFWGWSPGPVFVRPVYAPALVGWVGGPRWGVGVSFGVGFGVGGGVGWFPLGYGEPYVPGYGVSRGYFQRVNVTNTNITNINNVTNNYYNTTGGANNTTYANRGVPGAMTAVPTSTLTNSQPVAKSAVSVPASEAAKAPTQAIAPVTPTKESVLGPKAGSPTPAPPASAASRPVVTKAQPPAKPVPFSSQQEALAKNPGHPLDSHTQQQLRSQMPRQNGMNHPVPRPPQGQGQGQTQHNQQSQNQSNGKKQKNKQGHNAKWQRNHPQQQPKGERER